MSDQEFQDALARYVRQRRSLCAIALHSIAIAVSTVGVVVAPLMWFLSAPI